MASFANIYYQNLTKDKLKSMINLGLPASKKIITPQQKTHYLVVYGIMQTIKNIMLFRDFLVFWFFNILKNVEPTINDNFVNYFPVKKYFNSSKQNNIKFEQKKKMGFDS